MKLFALLLVGCTAPTPPAPLVVVNTDQPDTPAPRPTQADQSALPYHGIISLTVPGPDEDGTSYSAMFMQQHSVTSHFCEWGNLVGNCCYTANPTYEDPTQVSAGDIELADLTTGETTTSPFRVDPYGLDYSFYGVLWPAVGDMLQISAIGDTVHAFSVAATIPAPLAGLPTGYSTINDWDSNGAPFGISLAHNYGVTWTPAGNAVVDVALAGPNALVECRASDGDGALVIHKSILEAMFAPDDALQISVNRLSSVVTSSDNADIALEVQIGYGWMGNAQIAP